ncbi:RNA-directed DNA polymerase, eukaryota, nucleotide-binding alpha-beta plait domain protein [Tanacetum coccineum]
MGISHRSSYNSKEDQTQRISKSVFITNFPNQFSARDLWNVCLAYGIVIDVYIPFKKSKAGKKFAFVRFIKVEILDRLIENLCTIWIGRFKLHANKVRFERDPKSNTVKHPNTSQHLINSQPRQNVSTNAMPSFATVLSNGAGKPNANGLPTIVIDDSCIMDHDFSRSLMGKIKNINALTNLYFILAKEGFDKVKLSYLGGYWVLIEMDSVDAKEKIIKHVGVGSWFMELVQASNSFVCEERLAWVTIEGLPVKAMTRNTFAKILFSWGDLVDIADSDNDSLSCIRVNEARGAKDTLGILFWGVMHKRFGVITSWDFCYDLKSLLSNVEQFKSLRFPVAPPSPDYVPGPEHPPSPDYVPGPEHPPSPVEVPYVPEPEYPEYLVPADAEAPLEDQPLPADASPTALSPGYVADSDPEEDPEEDHADYPADGGDDDDEPSDDDDDDTDDEDEEPFEDEDDDEEEEEHLAPADSSAVPVVDPVPSAGDTEAFETDESAPTPRSPQTKVPFAQTRLRRARKTVRLEPPMSPSMEARIAEYAAAPTPPSPLSPWSPPLPQIPSPPLPPPPSSLHLPPPVPTSLPLPSSPLPPLPVSLFIPPPNLDSL